MILIFVFVYIELLTFDGSGSELYF